MHLIKFQVIIGSKILKLKVKRANFLVNFLMKKKHCFSFEPMDQFYLMFYGDSKSSFKELKPHFEKVFIKIEF